MGRGMSAMMLGKASYELDLDTSQFKTKADEAGSYLKNVIAVAAGIQFQELSEDLGQLGKELFKMVADFDHFVVTLGSQGAVATSTANAVAQAMLEMSRTTMFGANEMLVAIGSVAQRLETLTGRQVNVADSTMFMQHATNLATASSSDLNSTVSALINVMLAYKIPLDDVARATDLVFNLSRITGVEFITLSLAADRLKARLGEAAPELDDLGTILATVNEQGITGSRGLLVLVSGVDSLTSGSVEVNNELNRLGVGIYDAQGRFVGFRSVIEQLDKAYQDLSPQQRKQSADTLFSSQAANILLGIINAGTESYDRYNDRINTTGTASTGATQHLNDLDGQLTLLKNNFEATAISLGGNLEPAFTKVLSVLVNVSKEMAENEDAMLAVAIIAGGVLLGAVTVLTAALVSMAISAIVAASALSLLLLGIPIAVAAAIAAAVLLQRNWEQVLQWFKEHWATVALLIAVPLTMGLSIIPALILEMEGHWGRLYDILPGPFQALILFVAEAIDQVINTIIAGINEIDQYIPFLDEQEGTDFSGDIRTAAADRERAKQNKAAADWMNSGSIAGDRPDFDRSSLDDGGAGPGIVPPYTDTGPAAKKAKELSEAEKNLRALAAAWAIFSQTVGGSLEDFKVFLALHEANIALTEREQAALTALNTSQMLLTNQSYQLRLTWVQLAEEAARSGRSLNQVIADVFRSLGDKAKGLLDQILNGPTREGTELQLRVDRLRRQALLLERGGADSSRVDNKSKDGPQATAADRQLRALEREIEALQLEQSLRQTNIDIMRSEAILKDQALQTDTDVRNSHIFLGAVIDNVTGKFKALDDALGGIIARLGIELGIPQLDTGLPYVPSRMLAILDPGEGVLTAEKNREYQQGLYGPSGPLANFNMRFQGWDFEGLKKDMNSQFDNAVWELQRRGPSIPRGMFSGR